MRSSCKHLRRYILGNAETKTATATDYAETTLTCHAGTEINVVSVTWMSTTSDCGRVVTSSVHVACQGKRHCSFVSNPANLGGTDPCYRVLKELKIYYNCV